MRTLPLTAAAFSLMLAAPALAQSYVDERPAVATTGVYSQTSATMPASSWEGSAAGWDAHVSTCSARYRTYDAATDMYYYKPGLQRRCTLASTVGSPSEWREPQAANVGAPITPADHSLGVHSGDIISRKYDQN